MIADTISYYQKRGRLLRLAALIKRANMLETQAQAEIEAISELLSLDTLRFRTSSLKHYNFFTQSLKKDMERFQSNGITKNVPEKE